MPNTPMPPTELSNETDNAKQPRGRYYGNGAAVAADPGELATSEGHGINLRDLVDILLRRWLWMLLILLCVLALGIFQTATAERIYSSTAEITIRAPKRSLSYASADIQTIAIMEQMAIYSNITTQLRTLRSRDLQKKAFDSLPEEVRQEGFHGFPSVTISNSEKDQSVIAVSVKALSPQAAAQMVDVVIDAFITQDLHESRETVTTALEYIENEISRVSDELRLARSALVTFESRYGAVGADGKLVQFTSQVGTLKAAVDDAQLTVDINKGLLAAYPQKISAEERTIVSSFVEQEHPLLDRVDNRINDLELRRMELLLKFVPDAPEIKEVDSAIKAARELRTKYMVSKVTSRTSSVNPQYEELQKQYFTAKTDTDAALIRLRVLNAAMERKRKEMGQLPELEAKGAELKSKVTQLEKTYALLSENYQIRRISEASEVSNVRRLSTASQSRTPVSPNVPRNIAITFLLGLMLAVGVAVLLESLDDRIHSQSFLEKISNRPVMAHIPKVAEEESPQLIHHVHGHNAILESMRLLRSNLAFAAMDTAPKTIAVTSPGPSEGKTTTAINLAVVFALDGKRVVLVDADLRRPSLHSFFGLERTVGLTSVAMGSATLDQALQPTRMEGISVLTTGALPPNPPEVLNAKSTRQVFTDLAERFDVVIVDTPPAAGLSDVPVLSTYVDGIIIIASAEQTHRGQLSMALHTLEQLGAPVLGFILNKIDTSHYRYYYYYRYYNYNYGVEGQEEEPVRKRRRNTKHRPSRQRSDEDNMPMD